MVSDLVIFVPFFSFNDCVLGAVLKFSSMMIGICIQYLWQDFK